MGRTLAQTQATRQPAPLRALSVALFVVFHHDEAMLTRSLTAAIVAAQEGQWHSRITSRFTVIHNGNATDDMMRAVIRLARRSARDTVTVPISVMRQSHRHPLSGGHLSRDWNTALLFAFGSLAAPECDFAVLMQHGVVMCRGVRSRGKCGLKGWQPRVDQHHRVVAARTGACRAQVCSAARAHTWRIPTPRIFLSGGKVLIHSFIGV